MERLARAVILSSALAIVATTVGFAYNFFIPAFRQPLIPSHPIISAPQLPGAPIHDISLLA